MGAADIIAMMFLGLVYGFLNAYDFPSRIIVPVVATLALFAQYTITFYGWH